MEDVATSLNYSNEQQKDIKRVNNQLLKNKFYIKFLFCLKAIKLVYPDFQFKDIADKTKSNPLFFDLKAKVKQSQYREPLSVQDRLTRFLFN